jgi:hypothetical protein
VRRARRLRPRSGDNAGACATCKHISCMRRSRLFRNCSAGGDGVLCELGINETRLISGFMTRVAAQPAELVRNVLSEEVAEPAGAAVRARRDGLPREASGDSLPMPPYRYAPGSRNDWTSPLNRASLFTCPPALKPVRASVVTARKAVANRTEIPMKLTGTKRERACAARAASKLGGKLPRSGLTGEVLAEGTLPECCPDHDSGPLAPSAPGQHLAGVVESGTQQAGEAQPAGQGVGVPPKNQRRPAARHKEKRDKPPQP